MSQNQSSFPRWIPLLGGLLGSTTCGLLLYAFSVFIKPLMEQFGWTVAQVSLAYALVCLFFGLVGILAGRLNDKVGPRAVVLIGGLIMAFGFFMVSTITPPDKAALLAGDPAAKEISNKALYLFYLYYGVIAGIGGGLVYVPPIATAPKWWPDRRGLATGFSVVGLGLGSFIMAPLATRMIAAFGGTALPVFQYVGIAMAVMVVVTAFCLQTPPMGYRPAGWTPPAPPQMAGVRREFRDYTHSETMRTPQFWLLWAAYFCGSFAGLMAIGLIAKHGIDAMSGAYRLQQGLDAAAAIPPDVSKQIAMFAAWAPSTLAIFNAAVRVAIGPLADRIGSKKIFIVLFVLQCIAMLLLFPAGKNYVMLAACAGLIGWNYGAMFTLFPSTLLYYYGPTHQGSNYGVLFTAWGVAGFFGPFIGGKLQVMTGSFFVPFVVAATIVGIAAVILITLKAPEKKHA
ncbi:MAG: OFA family MFS transporter [Brachymonas sp.]